MNIFFRVEKGGAAHGVNSIAKAITMGFFGLFPLLVIGGIVAITAFAYIFRAPILEFLVWLLLNLPRAVHTAAHGG